MAMTGIPIITEMTRGHIRLKLGDKTVTIQGEMYLPGYGSPDFVAYGNTIQRWDPHFESETIDDRTKGEILAALKNETAKKGLTIEVE